MTENDFRPQFNKWVAPKAEYINCFFELKFVNTTRKKSIHYIRDFEPHQLDTLHEVQHNGIVYTISNQSFGKKPFDSMKIQGSAYVCIMFWKPYMTPHTFIMVNIDDFFRMIEESEKSYFTEETILKYGYPHVLLT